MQEHIKDWIVKNSKFSLNDLSQDTEFIDFLLDLITVTREKAIEDTHLCSIAIHDNNIENFSGCLWESLNYNKS
jgi:hypothetical protein